MNRFVWNMRYERCPRGLMVMIMWAGQTTGPKAMPGTYKVKLTVGDWSQEQIF